MGTNETIKDIVKEKYAEIAKKLTRALLFLLLLGRPGSRIFTQRFSPDYQKKTAMLKMPTWGWAAGYRQTQSI